MDSHVNYMNLRGIHEYSISPPWMVMGVDETTIHTHRRGVEVPCKFHAVPWKYSGSSIVTSMPIHGVGTETFVNFRKLP